MRTQPQESARKYLVVHHRQPGISKLESMMTLCPACHAIVHRLRALRSWLPPQLVVFWREQHPDAPFQLQFDLAGESFNPELVEVEV